MMTPQKRHRIKTSTEKRAFVLWLKQGLSCADCGGRFHPAAMDFDHDRGAKTHLERGISYMVNNTRSMAALCAELMKCTLRCANCHRTRTYARAA